MCAGCMLASEKHTLCWPYVGKRVSIEDEEASRMFFMKQKSPLPVVHNIDIFLYIPTR